MEELIASSGAGNMAIECARGEWMGAVGSIALSGEQGEVEWVRPWRMNPVT
jgi:hypothetical protein